MATIRLQYFKKSGKWGYEAQLHWDDDKSMHGLLDHVEYLGVVGLLPGLSSGTWDGPIYLDTSDHPMGYPLLIIPK